MINSPFRVLLIESLSDKSSPLFRLLSDIGYEIISLDQIAPAIDLIENNSADIVIYSNNKAGDTGFKAFNRLRPFLLKAGVPFLLSLDAFDKENVLIGLEMGIDNFLIAPFEKESVIFKIKNELKKKSELDVFDTKNFKLLYNSSLVAMFFMTNNRIKSANPAFFTYILADASEVLHRPVGEIFNISANPENELEYRHFRSGVNHSCILKNVKCCQNSQHFDLCFYRGNKMEVSSVFCEMLPSVYGNNDSNETLRIQGESINAKIGESTFVDDFNGYLLTEQEKVIFNLSSQGLAMKQIAAKLNISQRTVEKHRSNIMHKTNTSNFIETIAKVKQYARG